MTILEIAGLSLTVFGALMWAILRFGERSRAKENLPAVREPGQVAPQAAPARPVAKAASKPSGPPTLRASSGWWAAAPPRSASPVSTPRPRPATAPAQRLADSAPRPIASAAAQRLQKPSAADRVPPLRLEAPRAKDPSP
jgi:hypothetical protein